MRKTKLQGGLDPPPPLGHTTDWRKGYEKCNKKPDRNDELEACKPRISGEAK